jgi:ABC-type amino acid transport substrate-binding protein
LATVILFLAMAAAAQAQTAPPPAQDPSQPVPPGAEVTVATRIIAPFVMKDGAEISGFSVDLWRAIGAELDLRSRFVTYDTLAKLLDAVSSGQTDAGIAAISITAKRGERWNFLNRCSVPGFRSWSRRTGRS